MNPYTVQENAVKEAFKAVGTQTDLYNVVTCAADVIIELKSNRKNHIMMFGNEGGRHAWLITYEGRYFGQVHDPRDGLMMFDFLDRFSKPKTKEFVVIARVDTKENEVHVVRDVETVKQAMDKVVTDLSKDESEPTIVYVDFATEIIPDSDFICDEAIEINTQPA